MKHEILKPDEIPDYEDPIKRKFVVHFGRAVYEKPIFTIELGEAKEREEIKIIEHDNTKRKTNSGNGKLF